MATIAKQVIPDIGFDHGLFNIEFMYDAARDAVKIIEINPRMSSQFADLFEKVDGVNTYHILLDLALGRRPRVRKRGGCYAVAASCVMRTFANKKVVKLPDKHEIESILRLWPDVRLEILATEGKKLSEELQDSQSYRYGLMNVGGRDRSHALDVFEE